VLDDPLASQTYGVYLWAIEHAGGHLVNYVGKTHRGNSKRTFAKRFAEELEYERNRDLDVDVDLFLKGIRKEVPPHRDRIDEVLRAYRLFIAPLPDLSDRAFLKMEGTLIRTLHDAGGKYAQFMKNPRCNRFYFGRISMDNIDVFGLEALVSESRRARSGTGIAELIPVEPGLEDSKVLHDIQRFLSVPWREHGAKRTMGEHKGWYAHDWGDLVQRISYIDCGHMQDIPVAAKIAKTLRRKSETKAEWEQLKNNRETHREILALVRDALSAIEGPPNPQDN
jgi:hypothetical protein